MHSWWIRQAIKKVRFSMGPLGFLFEAAFAMSMEKSISMPKFPEPDDIVIKDDFVAWFVSNGGDTFSPFPTWVVKVPIFAFEYESIDIPTEIPAVVIPD